MIDRKHAWTPNDKPKRALNEKLYCVYLLRSEASMTKVGARQSESDGCRLKTVLTALIYMKAPTSLPSFEGSGEGDATICVLESRDRTPPDPC